MICARSVGKTRRLFFPKLRVQIRSLSKDVFERRTSTGSEAFSLFICLGANKFVLLSFFSLIKTIYQRVSTKPLPNDAKSPLPVDVRRSKTPLLKLPIKGVALNRHGKSHRFLFPFSTKFPDLNFVPYVLYIYLNYIKPVRNRNSETGLPVI